jgi:hypothetical protein
MISGRFVHLIETHWDRILVRIVEQIRREPELVHIRELLASEAREWGEQLLEHLGFWLTAENQEELARQYEAMGKLRFEQGIPLDESVRALCIIRGRILAYVDEHIASTSSVELYAVEELERRLGKFFDLLLVHLVRGYERALRRSVALTA